MQVKANSFLIAVAVLCVASVPAWAHAHPKSMLPAANSTVNAPAEVSIEFSEALEPRFSKLELLNTKGDVLSKQPSVVDPSDRKHISLPLPKLETGVYRVHWVSAATDGHRMDGDYTFTVK